ncbi:3-phosphoshikimate 1-carboxyvinyltransferase [Iamia sp. SCSIO 61187]|nr:3-phosphoshikimate 1-carboxyvinyltransferase [Iamia sp. SCSIO 61187]
MTPLAAPPAGVEVRVPGGRSVTNRALVAAALAEGTSVLRGAGLSDDSEAMIDCLRALGATVTVAGTDVTVVGVAGRPQGRTEVFTRLSGTTSRFVTAVAALADGPVRIDALPPMRARPMGDLVDALRGLGVTVDEHGEPGHLPLTVAGPIAGDRVAVPGTISSQYTSGLLLAGGARIGGLTVELGTDRLVSAPYVAMTTQVMEAFGVVAEATAAGFATRGGGYRASDFDVPADAATAAYLLAAAAVTGGTVTVPALPTADLQADVELVDVLGAMGCTVSWSGRDVTVTGPARGRLTGGRTFDLTAFSDMAPTVAVLAAFADGPVEVAGVGFIRGKETDRIAASVAELRRIGVAADETDDGFVVWPGGRPEGVDPHGAVIETYDDHRTAMSFALVGLVVPGISISDPTVVGKTHPGFWADLDRLRP